MLIVLLFVSYAHVNLCHFFSFSWRRGLAAASTCTSTWLFLDLSVYFFVVYTTVRFMFSLAALLFVLMCCFRPLTTNFRG